MSDKRTRERQELAALQRDEDLLAVLSTPSGRRVYWRLIDGMAGTLGPSFSTEPLAAAYTEGRRSIGIELMLEAQRVSPQLYLQMLAEVAEAQLKAAAEKQKEGPAE